jgi:hypothetical protein
LASDSEISLDGQQKPSVRLASANQNMPLLPAPVKGIAVKRLSISVCMSFKLHICVLTWDDETVMDAIGQPDRGGLETLSAVQFQSILRFFAFERQSMFLEARRSYQDFRFSKASIACFEDPYFCIPTFFEMGFFSEPLESNAEI